ncbi:MAG TPA: FtsQ-type POTRA domain-containing protein [Candidatus Angelobacter sp.]|nr:FtsQ-type POTRA domain-containing protein [Candidatus Angelobacter sp.]
MERLKPLQRNATAAVDAAERYRPELLADDEPRYLRRQKPVEIRRKKLAGRGWAFYRRLLILAVVGGVLATISVYGIRFLLYSPSMLLLKPEQIELSGNQVVSREAVLQEFAQDRSRSVLRIPLDERRLHLQRIAWVESATVQRVLPNRIRVELAERVPVAFARNGNELSLIDAHGVILDRPEGQEFQFPVVTGVSADVPDEQREKRMQLYEEFIRNIELVRGGSSQNVSEADLSNPKDLRVVMTGLARATDTQAVAIHFGSNDFSRKYKTLLDNFSQWRAENGCFRSIDLQYKYPVINPEPGGCSAK